MYASRRRLLSSRFSAKSADEVFEVEGGEDVDIARYLLLAKLRCFRLLWVYVNKAEVGRAELKTIRRGAVLRFI